MLNMNGIIPTVFGKHFSMLSFAANTNLTWLAFNSKYDFGYLLSLFVPLPDTAQEFIM